MKQTVTNPDITGDSGRDYLFDNLRAILIFLVVLGHILTSMLGFSEVIRGIYIFIYMFHMPAMTFISGYFSKKLEKIRSNAFETVLVPFLVINTIYYLFMVFVIREQANIFRILFPYRGLWYLLALFFWKFFLIDLLKIRYLLPLSFIVAIISGFSNEFSEYMAFARSINFLPFFLLGYYCTREHIRIIRKIPKPISLGVIALTAGITTYVVYNDIFKKDNLYMREPFPKGEELVSMLYRVPILVLAIAMIIVIINLTSERKTFLSPIGTRTMSVYVLHLFTVQVLEIFHILEDQPYLYILYAILMAVFLTYLFSRPIVVHGYNSFMDKLRSLLMKTNSR